MEQRTPAPDERATRAIEALEVFVGAHGHRPSSKAPGHDERVQFYRVRHRLRDENLHPAHRERLVVTLTAAGGAPRRGDDPQWFAILSELTRLVQAQGRQPKSTTERRLYSWLRYQRNHDGLARHRCVALDDAVPDWRVPPSEAKWVRDVEAYRSYLDAHAQRPRRHSTAAGERVLANWFARIHDDLYGTLSDRRRAMLDEQLPGWNRMYRRRPGWDECFERYVTFVSENGRRPRASNTDPEERTNYAWIRRQCSRALTEERAALLDAHAPGWRTMLRFV